ncbi:MAG: serine acetyltransferase [Thermoleophilales bacterium]|nr:serine acetyltransferase [Thermoleophilales bacterium]
MAGALTRVLKEVRSDVEAARVRDPAARDVSFLGILSSWGGVQALLAHRIAHRFHRRGARLAPRVIVYGTRALTGIEIHPGAKIGNGFFIDHGSGVVIGETAEIGDGVTIYQGVTLGGTGDQRGKRHPTVGDFVTIGSGAKLLGPIRVEDGAKIGANTVVVTDVPASATVVGNPGHIVRVDGHKPSGPDTDWIHLPDPVQDAIKQLSERLTEIERRLEAVDGEAAEAEVRELRPKRGPSTAGG